MLILLAPSKTQEPIKRSYDRYTTPECIEQGSELTRLLGSYSLEQLCTLMKMSPKLGTLTKERIDGFCLPLTRENSSQALFTFQGDAYSKLTPKEYSDEQLHHAQNHLRILSGLYGILKPLDLMHPYRLEMGTRFTREQFKSLYEFWGDRITEIINRQCEESGYSTVVSLASAEYEKVVKRKLLRPRLVTITFKEKKGDTFKSIPIYSKRARGLMAHTIITKGYNSVSSLKEFHDEGYSFNSKLSQELSWVFTRQ